MYKSSNNKQITLDNVELKEEIKNIKGIAIMLEQNDGTYKESSTNTFPTDMEFNSELSGCIDNLGNKTSNSLTYVNGIANVETSNTSYCYLYFNILATTRLIENVSSDVLWESTLEDDGYRYVGTDPANYVCFGYSDASTDCDFTNATNTDLYAYRIVGIFEDSSGEQHLKLIKKEALNQAYAWHSDNTVDIDWDESDLYKGINGSYFLTNTTYSYMQDSTWTNKIATWDYTATNTLTFENYNFHRIYGPSYSYNTVKIVYLHELNRSSKTIQTCYGSNSSTIADCSAGEWKTISSKISLMYASDYALSLGITALDYTNGNSTDYALMKTGWMHLENNDGNPRSKHEWTTSRYGDYGNGSYGAWYVYSSGKVNGLEVYDSYSVRPVFYLTTDVKISGEGTKSNPFVIS